VSNGENSNNFGAETDLLSHAGEEYNTGTGSGAHPPLFPRRSPAGFALTGVSAGRSASAPASSPALHPRSATPPAASAPPSVLPDTSLSAHGDSTSQPAPALSLSLSAPTASTLGSSAVPATDPPGSSTPLPGPGGLLHQEELELLFCRVLLPLRCHLLHQLLQRPYYRQGHVLDYKMESENPRHTMMTVRYGFLSSTGEPRNIEEALMQWI
jgi:hypothetical protein